MTICTDDVMELAQKPSVMEVIDRFEKAMIETFPISECPLRHTFSPGLYVREILMPAGYLITSKIHKTEHPFFIMQGKVTVYTEENGEVTMEAPYIGVTKPGTRRILYIHEDCIWATTHLTNGEETLEEIEERIIEKHDNPLLDENLKSQLKLLNK